MRTRMLCAAPVVFSLAAVFAGAVSISAAQALPAMAPTNAQAGPAGSLAANAIAPLAATAPAPAERAHRAEVRYADGLLSVNANNSGLNAILRQIGQQTGMRITGGVRDERVFGHYGPAEPAQVLETLLDGTGTNLLLRQTAGDAPLELVLTPRNGGPTPPNPNAPGFDDAPDEPAGAPAEPAPDWAKAFRRNDASPAASAPAASGSPSSSGPTTPVATLPAPSTAVPAPIAQPANNVLGNPANVTPTASQLPNVNSQSLDTVATPSTAVPPPQGIVDSTNPVPASNVAPTAPGAVTTPVSPTQGVSPVASPAAPPEGPPAAAPSTPEQVYQQLQKLRQQQQATPQ